MTPDFLTTDPREQLRIYLRLLYSPSLLDQITPILGRAENGVGSYLCNLNPAAFRLEQAARRRNLLKHLQRTAPGLMQLLGEPRAEAIVSEYAGSEQFWLYRGRTLTEDFCLFAADRPEVAQDDFLYFTTMAWGVISGLPLRSTAESPWSSRGVARVSSAQMVTEGFHSPYVLVTTRGEAPSAACRAEVEEKRNSVVRFSLLPNGVLFGKSTEVSHV